MGVGWGGGGGGGGVGGVGGGGQFCCEDTSLDKFC